MITMKLPVNLSDEDKEFIRELQKVQSSMIRTAYKHASCGCTEAAIYKELKNRFAGKLDSWFQHSATKSGMWMFEADRLTGRGARIFGGKKNFIRRCKNLISNDE